MEREQTHSCNLWSLLLIIVPHILLTVLCLPLVVPWSTQQSRYAQKRLYTLRYHNSKPRVTLLARRVQILPKLRIFQSCDRGLAHPHWRAFPQNLTPRIRFPRAFFVVECGGRLVPRIIFQTVSRFDSFGISGGGCPDIPVDSEFDYLPKLTLWGL